MQILSLWIDRRVPVACDVPGARHRTPWNTHGVRCRKHEGVNRKSCEPGALRFLRCFFVRIRRLRTSPQQYSATPFGYLTRTNGSLQDSPQNCSEEKRQSPGSQNLLGVKQRLGSRPRDAPPCLACRNEDAKVILTPGFRRSAGKICRM